jgi:crotonobetainyl-CoA:carnitine CoA-transferase CaiB-like acyl-CoA transferase
VGHPEWATTADAGPQDTALPGTAVDDAALVKRLGDVLARRPVDAWLADLASCGVPACAVLPRAGELANPFLVENDFSHVVDDPVTGKLRVVRAFSDWPGTRQPSARPPRGTTPGEETADILASAGIDLAP